MGFFGWFLTVSVVVPFLAMAFLETRLIQSWRYDRFLIALVAYFVGGAFNNYSQYGSTGFDMIPHRDMWRDLPSVIGDLFRGQSHRHSVVPSETDAVMTGRGGSRSGYSALG